MAKIIEVAAIGYHLVETDQRRDGWCCIHIENDNGIDPQPVCRECKWYGACGRKCDNYIERPDGRWKG